MKTRPASLAIICLCLLTAAAGADGPPLPDSWKDRDEAVVAWEFFQNHMRPTADGADERDWAAYLKENDLDAGGAVVGSAKRLVEAMQQTTLDGIGLRSKFFWPHVVRLAGEPALALSGKTPPPEPGPPEFGPEEQKTYNEHVHDVVVSRRFAERLRQDASIGKDEELQARELQEAARCERQADAAEASARLMEMKQLNRPPAQLAAAKIAVVKAEAVREADSKPLHAASPLLENSEKGGTPFYVLLGTRMTAPYTIVSTGPDQGSINSKSTTVRPFVQLGWRTFWTMDPKRKAIYPGSDKLWDGVKYKDPVFNRLTGIDIDVRGSIFFNQDQKIDSAAVASSGDLNGEISVEKLLYLYAYDDTAWSFGLGGRLGASSERSERRVHTERFAGGHLNFSSIVSRDQEHRLSLFRIGLGMAEVDHLRYDPASSRKRVVFDGDSPSYDRSWVPACDLEVWYPVSGFGRVNLGARLYTELDPSPWTVYIGYTIDPEKLFNGLLGYRDADLPRDQSNLNSGTEASKKK